MRLNQKSAKHHQCHPELVEGYYINNSFMVRQAHHDRLLIQPQQLISPTPSIAAIAVFYKHSCGKVYFSSTELLNKTFRMKYFLSPKCILIVFLSLIFFSSESQTHQQLSASEIKHRMQKLGTVGSVLYVAAHPDDENTRLISWLTNHQHYRTAYISLTRGDGGQNLIGNEQAEYLGLIRTHELIEARRIDGGEQYFSRAYDFGYSKTPDETFNFWNKEAVLADLVWVIRNFKPDIIINRFPTTGEGGHGHHTASAILAEEAFAAAADSKRFPEQLQYVQPWQAKRLLWNTYRFGSRNTTSEEQFKVDVGGFNPLLGKSYGEIAAESRSKHSSQAFGTARNRATQLEYLKTILGEAPQESLLDGINASWKRFSEGEKIDAAIQKLQSDFQFENPAASVPALIEIYELIEKSNADNTWKQVKLSETKNLIAACSGLWLEVLASTSSAALGDSVEVNVLAVNRSDVAVKLNALQLNGMKISAEKNLEQSILFSENYALKTDEKNQSISQPYWLQNARSNGMFDVKNQLLIGNAQNAPALSVAYELNISGKHFSFEIPVQFKVVDPAKGEIYQPFVLTPSLTATIENEVYVFADATAKDVNIKLKAFRNNAQGTLKLQLPAGWKCVPASIDFHLVEKGNEQLVKFSVLPDAALPQGKHDLKAIIVMDGKETSYSHVQIKYEHIPQQTLFPAASAKLVKLDLKRNKKLIGYITGAGDKVPDGLRHIGYEVREVSEAEFLNGKLQQYDAIISGVRAYNTDERLKNWQVALLKYVEQGGVLLIQYNTSQKLVTENIGPYPFKLSRERVTEEDAEVKILLPKHPALQQPNKITAKDFEGWVQERGLYFPAEADARYAKPFSMNDTGENPSDSSTLIADHGKGRFIYTGLSFFRQLPAGVPGAYRLLVNLLEK